VACSMVNVTFTFTLTFTAGISGPRRAICYMARAWTVPTARLPLATYITSLRLTPVPSALNKHQFVTWHEPELCQLHDFL
jgi:hypothetical protein